MIPGRGAPVAGAVVLLDGPAIAYAGPAAEAPPAAPDDDVTTAAVVMPGLWDCHVHLLGQLQPDLAMLPREPIALRAARGVAGLRAALDAGVTSIRELAGLGADMAPAVAEGTIAGPAIHAAGAAISPTGGHVDLHSYPLSWVHEWGATSGDLRVADGTAECARVVREQLRRNAKVIKVCASGGVMSEVDHPMHQQFTDAELRILVEVAGLAERVVAAHCHGKPGMIAALEAGVRTIEHGTYLDEECADAMRETGAILVPTRFVIHSAMADLDRLPPYAQPKMRAVAERHAEAIALAHRSGVTIAMGTDIGAGDWGRHGEELPLLVESGLTPLEAIEAATANGPATLGPQAPRSGRLAEGYDADLLILDDNPLDDIAVLADPARVRQVWKAGRRVK
ncbi:amidohydrolase family protein [Actinoplanes sp. NPDC049265]|uniref:metal-dependent hydrolase family protein n=1 Tax=Actinoplanes sp. NPDC049265 TaxID=3363902 RepID=UPI003717B97F